MNGAPPHRKVIALPARARILVIALRRLGDVLLTTPLIRSLKRSFPQAAIDALVFAGTEGILAGNPDLARVITTEPGNGAGLALLRTLWRQYDLALSTQAGDRPIWLAWIAGRTSGGPVRPGGGMAKLKRMALDYPVAIEEARHRVEEVLELATALDIPSVRQLVCPAGPLRNELLPQGDYAVVHAGPMFRYKRWSADGWRALAVQVRMIDAIAMKCGAQVSSANPWRASSKACSLGRSSRTRSRLPRFTSAPTHPSPISPRRPAPRPLRSMDQRIPAASVPGPARVFADLGTPPVRFNAAETCGWCKIRCLACLARTRAATDTSTATAAAWTSCRCAKFWRRSTKPWAAQGHHRNARGGAVSQTPVRNRGGSADPVGGT